MGKYEAAYTGLNKAQKQAVDTIDGPVLVLAGPGTGKTQLLGVRVARILEQTDTLPQNILCLTFTESGADNMRERLTRFIGQAAYDVNISTYHAFGANLIGRFPEFFAETRLQSAVDQLAQHQILRTIVDNLSYTNPLKQVRHHLGDLISTVSEVKRALLDGNELRALAKENSLFIASASSDVQEIFGDLAKLPGTAAKALPLFERLFGSLEHRMPKETANERFPSLASIAVTQLAEAVASAKEIGKSKPLTAWKNEWLAKDEQNRFICSGALENRRITALADVFDQYQQALDANGWYDFDDMILRSIKALEQNPDLRYSLQEQYLYVLLDEFQDTNAAQLRLVQLLTDNPVNEGRPNVLAVGDDDQAIYAFQGAQYSNMIDFSTMYKSVDLVSLTENYRSTPEILSTAQHITAQINARLETHFPSVSKNLTAATKDQKVHKELERREFLSDVAQYDWLATRIKALIDHGTSPKEIAVLAPKHKQLEPLVPYLKELGIPLHYERRENILESAVVRQLLAMSRLVLALHAQDEALANALWPEVLSFDFWQIPVAELWQLSWRVRDSDPADNVTWSKLLLASEQLYIQEPALLFLGLANKVDIETCEQMLDYLIGTDALHIAADGTVRSPLRSFYTSDAVQEADPDLFYTTISHLTVLRSKLREYETAHDGALDLQSLLTFVGLYEEAGERMQSTSPYSEQADAVQLMTVFKAKGLEFEHVFLPSCQDDVWGSTSRGNANKLTLPANLAPIRHAGATEDERLRILFVAMTRAKLGLHLLSFERTYSGKATKRLKYLDEQEQDDGSFKALVLPEKYQMVIASSLEAPPLSSLELNWRTRHSEARSNGQLQGLLTKRLARYQLSPTHLTKFLDLEYAGPEAFFFDVLLGFPQAPSTSSQFGDAIHETLEWVQYQTTQNGTAPIIEGAVKYFVGAINKRKLTPAQKALEQERGEQALAAYLSKRSHIFKPTDKAEQNFRNEGVLIGDVHMSGKVDRMEIDKENKTIAVVDYKTGRAHSRWSREAALYKYQLQLYCYKLLIEHSHSYKGYTVTSGRLEFIEPDQDNRIHTLELHFNEERLEQVGRLLTVFWKRIHALDFPNVSSYEHNLSGIEKFEKTLLEPPEGDA